MKVSVPAILTLCLPLASGQAPSNDEWPGAQPIGPGFVVGSNIGATTSSPTGNCGLMGNDVWYSFVAGCTGTADVTLCGPGTVGDYDTVVAGWCASPGCAVQPGLLACNDDTCGVRSHVAFGVVAGRTYFISVGGFAADVGNFAFLLSCSVAAAPPPINDACANAIAITDGDRVAGSNLGASLGATDPFSACASLGADVWYTFTPTQDGVYTVTTCLPGATLDTIVDIFAGGCTTAVHVDCNDDGCYLAGGSLRSTATFTAAAGVPHLVAVGGFNGATGYYELGINFKGPMKFDLFTGGPGSLGVSVSRGPPGGSYFAAFTVHFGNYPDGWFLGIDIELAELALQLNTGFPFLGSLDGCGRATIGPVNGAPSGLTILGAAVGFQAGSSAVAVISGPDFATVP
jgi:hypothetical protein